MWERRMLTIMILLLGAGGFVFCIFAAVHKDELSGLGALMFTLLAALGGAIDGVMSRQAARISELERKLSAMQPGPAGEMTAALARS